MGARYIHKGRPSASAEPKACAACSGSGRYDDTGSPTCGACGGSGIEEARAAEPPRNQRRRS